MTSILDMRVKGGHYVEPFEKAVEHKIYEREINKAYIENVNPFSRYKKTPFHAVFLYSPQHNYIKDYLIKKWDTLSSMSENYCDLYVSIYQLYKESGTFDEIKQINADTDISKLPGILFWEKEISNNRFLSFRDLSEKDITNLLQTVFQQIRMDPKMDSITKRYEFFKKDSEKERASNFCPIPVYMSMIPRKNIFYVFVDWLLKKYPDDDLKSNSSYEVLKERITEFVDCQKESKLPGTVDDDFLFEELKRRNNGKYYEDIYETIQDYKISEKVKNKDRIKSMDPINRYKIVPLHAIFLYSSLNNYIGDYITKNWSALSSMSGDCCDLYISIDQLNNESDAFDEINQINADIDISRLPGILFWEKEISNNHFLSFRDLNEKDITNLLQTVFQQIRMKQKIDSIKKGEELFNREIERNKAGYLSTAPSMIMNIGTVNGKVVGQQTQGDRIYYNQILSEIFESLEWNDENRKRIEEIERVIKCDQTALEEVKSSINKLVNENATNKSFISKLKVFASDALSGASGNLIASTILFALKQS